MYVVQFSVVFFEDWNVFSSKGGFLGFFLYVKSRFLMLSATLSGLPTLSLCKRSGMVKEHLNLLEVLNMLW